MTCKEKLKLVRTAIDECRLDFAKIRKKYPPDDGDGLTRRYEESAEENAREVRSL